MGLVQGFKGMVLPTGVSLSASAASIGIGVEYQLEAYITPELASNNKIHWSASNNNVTVDENGLVTGVTDGTSVVTATTDYGGYTASCTFTVFSVPVTGVSLDVDEITLTPGETYQLTATITPNEATNKNVTWRSTNTSVAVVDNNGLVTCIANGDAEIIVTTVDGNYSDSCSVGTIIEYVLLSEGGSVNKFSELSQASNNTSPAIRNNTTNWIAQSLQTDKNTSMYKVFDKEIIGFDVIFQLTETYSYEGLQFHLQANTGTAWVDENSFTIGTENDRYGGRYGVTYWVNGTQTYSTGSTTRDSVRVVGEKSGNTWTITVTGGATFTKTFTTSDVYKSIMFSSWRWYTSNNIGNYSKAVVYLV